VDLTRRNGRPKARLLDLVPGRSGKAYADWLTARGEPFTGGVGVATLDPFRGYFNAIRDELEDATAVLDAFHVVKLVVTAMEETRRRVQQQQLGHAARSTTRSSRSATSSAPVSNGSPIDRSNASRPASSPATPTTRSPLRGAATSSSGRPNTPAVSPRGGRSRSRSSTASTPARSPKSPDWGRTLRAWKQQFLAYFTTSRANNGGTEAINGIIELHRRIARGFRNLNNYRLRMILAAGGLTHPTLR
jgi:transposase